MKSQSTEKARTLRQRLCQQRFELPANPSQCIAVVRVIAGKFEPQPDVKSTGGAFRPPYSAQKGSGNPADRLKLDTPEHGRLSLRSGDPVPIPETSAGHEQKARTSVLVDDGSGLPDQPLDAVGLNPGRSESTSVLQFRYKSHRLSAFDNPSFGATGARRLVEAGRLSRHGSYLEGNRESSYSLSGLCIPRSPR